MLVRIFGPQRDEVKGGCIVRNFMICAAQEGKMGRACGTYGGE